MGFFADLWKGHVLAFERPLVKLSGAGSIFRFLIAFLVVGVGILLIGRRVLEQAARLDPLLGRLLLAILLLLVSVAVARILLGSAWSNLGLRPLAQWTRREILYAMQVIPLAAFVFFLIFRPLFVRLIEANGGAGFVAYGLIFGLAWGFYQEFAYRGLLQNALSSALGPFGGVILANVIFTFGPLHAFVYAAAASDPSRALLFVPIFGIGLVFGVLYQRSGNLWLPAIFHGMWPLNMT